MHDKIKVVELFAGVGGFRLGLEGWKGKSSSSNYKKELNSNFEVIWSNQWEPSTIKQHANDVYEYHWGTKNHYRNDINNFASPDFTDKEVREYIPKHDLLVGGFPCQDYSVAGVNTNGIKGKKGVLWWNIHKILKSRRPSYVLLENVDRLNLTSFISYLKDIDNEDVEFEPKDYSTAPEKNTKTIIEFIGNRWILKSTINNKSSNKDFNTKKQQFSRSGVRYPWNTDEIGIDQYNSFNSQDVLHRSLKILDKIYEAIEENFPWDN